MPTPGRVLLVGGIRSGKSREAERRLMSEREVTYVATGLVDDEDREWAERVAVHRSRRPASWKTIETLDVATLLRDTTATDPPILLDCVNLWLARTMTSVGCWERDEPQSTERLAAEVAALVAAWSATSARITAVTNEVGMALVPTTRSGRWFAEALGDLNRRLAEAADEVWLVTVGIPTRLR